VREKRIREGGDNIRGGPAKKIGFGFGETRGREETKKGISFERKGIEGRGITRQVVVEKGDRKWGNAEGLGETGGKSKKKKFYWSRL